MSAFGPNDTSIAVLFLGFQGFIGETTSLKLSKLNGTKPKLKCSSLWDLSKGTSPVNMMAPFSTSQVKKTGSEVEVNLTIL